MNRIIPLIMIIKNTVDHYHWVTIPAKWCPAKIICIPPPGDPGRSPDRGWNPVPAKAYSPVPAAIMESRPAPGLIGHPGPASDRNPGPVTIVIRAPVIINVSWHPDIAVRGHINPVSIFRQFSFEIAEIFWQVAAGIIFVDFTCS